MSDAAFGQEQHATLENAPPPARAAAVGVDERSNVGCTKREWSHTQRARAQACFVRAKEVTLPCRHTAEAERDTEIG
jgi:hypothetical protein